VPQCFQKTPLDFDRNAQVLVWNNGSLTYPMKSKVHKDLLEFLTQLPAVQP